MAGRVTWTLLLFVVSQLRGKDLPALCVCVFSEVTFIECIIKNNI